MRSGVAQALRPRVWHDCALFFFDLDISYFTGFGTRLGRILAVQNQINPFYALFVELVPRQTGTTSPYSIGMLPGSLALPFRTPPAH